MHTPSAMRRLLHEQAGASLVEYTVLIGLVALSTAAAIVLLGPALVTGFENARDLIVAPFP